MHKSDPAQAYGHDGDSQDRIGGVPWTGQPGKRVQASTEYWDLAQMALDLGKDTDAARFLKLSDSWKPLLHPEQGLLMARPSETHAWEEAPAADPLHAGGWVEANAWQGTFGLSHDIPELAQAMGGPDVLARKLDFAFSESVDTDFVYSYGGGYVSYANQPGCSNAHVFNHVGYPWLSQYWVRQVSQEAYGGTNPNIGYGGHDEDQGQMGGISALMKIGLFSLRGGTAREPIYEITTPEFEEVVITLDPRYYSGETFTIKAHHQAPENVYIQKAALNGQPLENCWIYHKDFAAGGVLELWLGPEPNKAWGKSPVDIPLEEK